MLSVSNDRCYIDFATLGLETFTARRSLHSRGFRPVAVDMVSEARARIGKSKFKLSVDPHLAPDIVDCSSFTKWLYGLRGIDLPRYAAFQYERGKAVEISDLRAGDLVFTSGYCRQAWYVGHVSLFTGESVVTAMIVKGVGRVVEMPLAQLLDMRELRGARRYAVLDRGVTFLCPERYRVQGSVETLRSFVLSLAT